MISLVNVTDRVAVVELSRRGRKLEPMAHVRKDTLAKTVQWWRHLRPFWKRRQQRRERRASAKLIRIEWADQGPARHRQRQAG